MEIGKKVKLKNSISIETGHVIGFLKEDLKSNDGHLIYIKGSPKVKWQNGTEEYYDKVELIILKPI